MPFPVLGPLIVASFLASIAFAQYPDVLYLRFEEGSGTQTTDWAAPGTGVIGNLIGGCALSTGNAPLGIGALVTGSNAADGVVFLNATTPSTSSFTIEFWMELPTVPGTTYAFGGACGGPPVQLGFGIDPLGAGGYLMTLWTGSTVQQSTATLTPAFGNWCHFAFVWDAGVATVTWYVNSALFTTATNPPSFPSLQSIVAAQGFAVGGAVVGNIAAPGCAAVAPQGQVGIDEFRIWSWARTATEVAANYFTDLGANITFIGAVPGAPITFNTAAGTFSASAPVNALGTYLSPNTPGAGLLPVGASISVSGTYTGSDLLRLTDVTFAPATVQIVAQPNLDEVVIQGVQTAIAAGAGYSTFQGSTAEIVTRRALRAIGTPTVNRIGSGSLALDGIATSVSGAITWSVVVEIGMSGPRFIGVTTNYATPVTTPESRLTTDGTGDVVLGDVGLNPGSRVVHLFVPQPTIAVGTGPLLGLESAPTVFDQLQLPSPTTPFNVNADGNGAYAFLLGPGAIPAGFVTDTITIEILPSGQSLGYVSPVRRITF